MRARKISRLHAESLGYTVDRSCYPWVAYRGPRFNPTEFRWCWTDTEHNQRTLIGIAVIYAVVEMIIVLFLLVRGGPWL